MRISGDSWTRSVRAAIGRAMDAPMCRSGRSAIRRVVPTTVWRSLRRRQPHAMILAYHRVAELSSDPWNMCVAPNRFREQMAALRDLRIPIIPLAGLPHRLGERGFPRRAIAVTFDDGYDDFLHEAAPVLEEHEAPTTLFVTTGLIDAHREFWWDELERLVLEPQKLPEQLRLRIIGSWWQWQLGGDAHLSTDDVRRDATWRAWEDPPTARHALYYDLWVLLYHRGAEEKLRILQEVAEWAGLPKAVRPTHRILSSDQISELSRSSLIDIGAHSVGHPALSAVSTEEMRREVAESKVQLEACKNGPVSSFSYPHGDYDDRTPVLVREAGFLRACSLKAGAVRHGCNPFTLPRMEVPNWDGEMFIKQMHRFIRA